MVLAAGMLIVLALIFGPSLVGEVGYERGIHQKGQKCLGLGESLQSI